MILHSKGRGLLVLIDPSIKLATNSFTRFCYRPATVHVSDKVKVGEALRANLPILVRVESGSRLDKLWEGFFQNAQREDGVSRQHFKVAPCFADLIREWARVQLSGCQDLVAQQIAFSFCFVVKVQNCAYVLSNFADRLFKAQQKTKASVDYVNTVSFAVHFNLRHRSLVSQGCSTEGHERCKQLLPFSYREAFWVHRDRDSNDPRHRQKGERKQSIAVSRHHFSPGVFIRLAA